MFDTYWKFAAARHQIYEARPRTGGTVDPRPGLVCAPVHQLLPRGGPGESVPDHPGVYRGEQRWEEVFFRTLVFKIFNRVSTWRGLTAQLGAVTWAGYHHSAYDKVLAEALSAGQRVYSAAYIVPSPPFGEARKHRNHLRLLDR